MLIWVLVACELLEEVREPTTEVRLQGTLLAGPPAEDAADLVDASVRFEDLAGQLLAEGEQPFEDALGVWRAVLPPGAEYALRIEAPDSHPAVWRGRAPSEDGYWFTGALFSWPTALVDPFLDELDAAGMGPTQALATGEVAHLWGSVDATARERVSAADIAITDGRAQAAVVWAFELSEAGLLEPTATAPVDYFFAFDLAPGDVVVSVGGESDTWPARGGDLVTPWWFWVP